MNAYVLDLEIDRRICWLGSLIDCLGGALLIPVGLLPLAGPAVLSSLWSAEAASPWLAVAVLGGIAGGFALATPALLWLAAARRGLHGLLQRTQRLEIGLLDASLDGIPVELDAVEQREQILWLIGSQILQLRLIRPLSDDALASLQQAIAQLKHARTLRQGAAPAEIEALLARATPEHASGARVRRPDFVP